jgi:hypothetical protein
VHHEADHEERAELELAGRERGPDREALAEVVDADPDRDEQREREPVGADLPRESRGEEASSRARCAATPSRTSPGRRATPGAPACSSSASKSASTPRNVSSPR